MEKQSNFDKYQSSNIFQKFALNVFYNELRKVIPIKDSAKNLILDAGCGEGFGIVEIRKTLIKSQIIGVDINKDPLKYARKNYSEMAAYSQANIYQLPFQNKSFDLIFCLEVLEHLKFPQKALREIIRVAKKYFIISVPNEPIYETLRFLSLRNLRRLGRCEEHLHRWTRQQFLKILQIDSVGMVKTKCSFPFAWNIFLFEKK